MQVYFIEEAPLGGAEALGEVLGDLSALLAVLDLAPIAVRRVHNGQRNLRTQIAPLITFGIRESELSGDSPRRVLGDDLAGRDQGQLELAKGLELRLLQQHRVLLPLPQLVLALLLEQSGPPQGSLALILHKLYQMLCTDL
eukprot:CAMPEP_0170549746 /NCGR_PEP_ID=MMETSP0211-20121228/7895_1 /TAXON_ID=311385 /ORGANISM="Pseudokeronopsis sp., Strain OXSARD2" /LENGTH=140 /DNA_ID=CAMNT_0010855947 /DNA_START=305 /DNA_END=724 /DNA_ORIENTATION=-